ncbi:MAG: succinate dehydrogenase, cytochrome b556 subunit [Gammaproteobacteria bacterium]
MDKDRRPVFLDLTKIHLPVMAVMSIAHRIAGVVMFLLTPVAIYLLDLSLSSQQGYQESLSVVNHQLFRLFLVFSIWALAHHFFAGLRYLLLDIDIGIDREMGRKTAWATIAGGVMVMFISAIFLL